MCCLVETFPANHASLEEYLDTLECAYLYAKTVTLGETHWPETNRVLLRNRRVGCSMSGIAQFISSRGLHQLKDWCEKGYERIGEVDLELSDEFAIPRSIKTTSIKPSGTVSILAGGKCTCNNMLSKQRQQQPPRQRPQDCISRRAGLSYGACESRLIQIYCCPFATLAIRSSLTLVRGTFDCLSLLQNLTWLLHSEFEKCNCVLPARLRDRRAASVLGVDVGAALARGVYAAALGRQSSELHGDIRPGLRGPPGCPRSRFLSVPAQRRVGNILTRSNNDAVVGVSLLPRLEFGSYPQMPLEAITEQRYAELRLNIQPIKFASTSDSAPDESSDNFCDTDVCAMPGNNSSKNE